MNTHEYQAGIAHGEREAVDPARYRRVPDYARGVNEGRACAILRVAGHEPPVGIGAAIEAVARKACAIAT